MPRATTKPGPTPKPRERRLTLDSIRSAHREAPLRMLLMGVEGVGKSTFGASAPAPVFLSSEDGIRHLDVPAFPEPDSWDDVIDALESLALGGHEYKTLVVDTVDWLEPLVWRHLCRRNGWDSIESPGYGKGYTAALAEWQRLIVLLQRVRVQGLQVILLAHAAVRNFSDPREDADYQRYECKLYKTAAAVLREWVDVCGFATFETWTEKKKTSSKAKGISSGQRVLHTRHSAAYDAKTRIVLPDPLPLDYETFAAAVASGGIDLANEMRRELGELLLKLPDDKRETASGWAEKAGDDPVKLGKLLDKVRGAVAQEGGE